MTNRSKAFLGLGGVFLLGLLCGALIVGLVVRDRVRQAERFHDPEGFKEYFVDRLRLTEAQRDSLQEELENTYEEIADLRNATADEYRQLLDTLTERITPVLTADQVVLLRYERQRFQQGLPVRNRPLRMRPRRLRDVPIQTPAPVSPASTIESPHPKPAGDSQENSKTNVPQQTIHGSQTVDSTNQRQQDKWEVLSDLMRDKLELNAEQEQKVKVNIKQAHEEFRKAWQTLQDDPRLLRAAISRILPRMEDRIAAELTPEQQAKYPAVREEVRLRIRKEIKATLKNGN